MKYYVAFLAQSEMGDSRALLPDLPICNAQGLTPDDATSAAALACSASGSAALPMRRPPSEIETDMERSAGSGVDFSKAVVTMISPNIG